MPDPPRDPGSGDAAALAPDREAASGTPRWVKVSAIVVLVIVVLVAVMLVVGGDHGPGRH